MEDHSIFEALSQLESDLKDIKTAKEQIDDVLEADSKINANLADYSRQLASIATQLDSLKELIQSELQGIVSNIDSDVTEHLASVGKLVSNIGELSSEIENNAKKIVSNTTEAMNDSCNKVIKYFEASTQKTSDLFSKQASDCVERVVQATTDFSASKKEIFHKMDTLTGDLSALQRMADSIKKDISAFVNESVQQTENLQTAKNNINQILTNLESYEHSLQSAVKTVEEKNDKDKNELKGAIETNKKILFLVIALVIIDIILKLVV